MYLAKHQDSSLLIYHSLFKRLASGVESSSEDEIKDVLIEAKKIYEGTRDIYSARSEYFHLVSFLISKCTSTLEKIDKNSIDRSTFENIAKSLRKEEASAY